MRSRERSHFARLREQADEVGNRAQRAHAGPEDLDAARVSLTAREGRAAQGLSRVLRVVGVEESADFGLVGQDEDVAQTCELLRGRRNVVVADQDVLVFFFDQLVARRNNHLNHILAGWQHGSVEAVRIA